MSRNFGLPNPEAPMEGLHDHWNEEPPEQQSPWWWLCVIVLVCVIMIGLILAFTWGEGELR